MSPLRTVLRARYLSAGWAPHTGRHGSRGLSCHFLLGFFVLFCLAISQQKTSKAVSRDWITYTPEALSLL